MAAEYSMSNPEKVVGEEAFQVQLLKKSFSRSSRCFQNLSSDYMCSMVDVAKKIEISWIWLTTDYLVVFEPSKSISYFNYLKTIWIEPKAGSFGAEFRAVTIRNTSSPKT